MAIPRNIESRMLSVRYISTTKIPSPTFFDNPIPFKNNRQKSEATRISQKIRSGKIEYGGLNIM